ncbi:MAG: DUF370 domain-containing protein [Leptospiraceae bacterium]|nr:DUF370 domain-containing protein [Leptospiraceae bacterium]MCP5500508.1 DUF370 domain-containing protein [Leptospiraceae bacterium]
MKILNIGFSNIVMLSRIISIIHSESAGGKRLKQEAKTAGKLVDATMGRKNRSIILMDSGHVVLSSLRLESIYKRIESEDNTFASEEEEVRDSGE